MDYSDDFLFTNNDSSNQRLDMFLCSKCPELSRTTIQRNIRDKRVSVNGIHQKSNYKLSPNDKISANLTDYEVGISDISVEDKPLDIIFENDDVIVINKPAGLTVHPTPNIRANTLVNRLLKHHPQIVNAVYDKSSKVSQIRPGIIHRLDKDTTGVMAIAKNSKTLHYLSMQMKSRKAIKQYLGLCCGTPLNNHGTWQNYLGRNYSNRRMFSEVGEARGKMAITKYSVMEIFQFSNKDLCLCQFDIFTGRTHQIRAQSLLHHIPIIGDGIYFTPQSYELSKKLFVNRQMLHSKSLTILLPGFSIPSTFEADVPEDFKSVLYNLHT